MLKRISYTEARDILTEQPCRLQRETVPLADALGRVLAVDITSPFPVPQFDKSPFDGYALRSGDVPGILPVMGESAAGMEEVPVLPPNAAVRIFTGAPVPPGADAVIKQEDVRLEGACIRVENGVSPGFNVIRVGEELSGGTVVAAKGSRITPATLGVLASMGIAELPVWKKSRVILIHTGSELVEPGEVRPPYKIFNSSGFLLGGCLRGMGMEVESPGILPDDERLIARRVDEAMTSDADLVITTGGASVGDYDFAWRTAQNTQAEILFWKLNMKPGGAMLASRKNGKLYLGLSGNPAAALMCLLVVAQPFIRKLGGMNYTPEEITLPLKYPLPKASSATRLLRGHLEIQDGGTCFVEHEGRGNGTIRSFEACDLIGIIPGNSGELPAGAMIRALRLPPDLWL